MVAPGSSVTSQVLNPRARKPPVNSTALISRLTTNRDGLTWLRNSTTLWPMPWEIPASSTITKAKVSPFGTVVAIRKASPLRAKM